MLSNNVLVENVDEEIMVTIEKKPETRFEEYVFGLLGKIFFESQYQWIKQYENENGVSAKEEFDLEINEEYNPIMFTTSTASREENCKSYTNEEDDSFPF